MHGKAIIKSNGREVSIEIFPKGFYVVQGRDWHGLYPMDDPRFEIIPPDHVLCEAFQDTDGAEYPLQNYP